jgi:hypothetical protein
MAGQGDRLQEPEPAATVPPRGEAGPSRYRSRFRPEPEHAEAFTPTSRDFELFAWVARFRFASTSQIERRFFPSYKAASRRLRLLFHHRLLSRVHIPVQTGQPEAIYHLSPANLTALKDLIAGEGKFGLWDELRQLPTTPQDAYSPYFLDHELALTEFLANLEAALEASTFRLLFWERETKAFADAVADPERPSQRIPVRPDAFFGLENPEGLKAFFFVEMDNGTMPSSRFKEKLRGYLEYSRLGKFAGLVIQYQERYAFSLRTGQRPGFRVLVVARDRERGRHAGRRDLLFQVALELQDVRTFWFTDYPSVASPETILGPVWIRGQECGEAARAAGALPSGASPEARARVLSERIAAMPRRSILG